MTKWRILAVDDDAEILTQLRDTLSDDACVVETVSNAQLAWERLDLPVCPYHIVILDRLMPGPLDGLALLRRLKTEPRLAKIPVIVQTSANLPDQIAEGIEAGAFYYLTKPYAMTTLQCILRSVIGDLELQAEVSRQAATYLESLQHFTRGELSFATLEDVNQVAGLLAAMCPDPESASQGLVELLVNAVEHGNLGITYDEKKQLMYDERWEEELRHRLTLPEYRDRQARVSFERKDGGLEFRITDQGKGFNWEQYLHPDPARSLDPNGRGIAMARRFSFTTLQFEGTGNVVVATVG